MTEQKPPSPRSATVRAQMEAELRKGPATARELSSRAGIPEREVVEHLLHLAKSLKARGGRLIVHPASCLACGYTFRRRTRLTRPGACPECRATHIEPPAFEISGPAQVDQAERRQRLIGEALAAEQETLETGQAFNADEVHAAMAARARGAKAPRLKAKPWRK